MKELVHDLRASATRRRPAASGSDPSSRASARSSSLGSDLLGPASQRRDRRHHVERSAPGAKGVASSRTMASALAAFVPTHHDALLDDPFEIVDVVEEAAVEVVDGGVEISRYRDVDEEDGLTAALVPARPLDLLGAEHEPLRAGRGDDDVGLGDLGRQSARGSRRGRPGARRARPPRSRRAVGDDQLADPAGDQVGCRELRHLAGADRSSTRRCREIVEHPRRKPGGGRRHGGRRLADRRLPPNPPARVQRLAKETVENRAGSAAVVRRLVRRPHLTEDLGLARDRASRARLRPGRGGAPRRRRT